MAGNYVGSTLAAAAAGDLVLAFVLQESDNSISTPAGWSALTGNNGVAQGGVGYNLRAFYVPSWSSSHSTSPNWGSGTLAGYAVYNGTVLDAVAVSDNTNNSGTTQPAVKTSTYADIIVSAFAIGMSNTTVGAASDANDAMESLSNAVVTGNGGGFAVMMNQSIVSPPQGSMQADTWTYGGSGTFISACIAVSLTAQAVPTAPTLAAPTPTIAQDATQPIVFSAQYNNTDSSACGAYQLRIKQTSASSYSYWNGAALVSSPAWVSGSCAQVTLPANTLANGSSYQWSMATQSNAGTSLDSGFATDIDFNTQLGPAISITSPTAGADVSTANPTISFSYTGGATQSQWQAWTYLTSTAEAPGFWAGQTTGLLSNDSGYSSSTSFTIGTSLPNADSITTFVQVTQVGNQQSPIVSVQYSTDFNVPNNPTVTWIQPDFGTNVLTINTQGVPAGAQIEITYVDYVGYSSANNPGTVISQGSVRGFNPYTLPAAAPQVTVTDVEIAPIYHGQAVTRVYFVVVIESTSVTGGEQTLIGQAAVVPVIGQTPSSYLLVNPLTQQKLMLWVSDQENIQKEQITVHYPLNDGISDATPVVETDSIFGMDGTLTCDLYESSDVEVLEELILEQAVLYLVTPFGRQKYIRLGAPPAGQGIVGQVFSTKYSPGATPQQPVQQATIYYVEMAKP